MAKTYISKQGDTWDLIAKTQLGDEHLMHKLIEVNFDLRKIAVFPQGETVILPEITAAETATTQSNLPPWKRT